jgi:hypothetical protein
MSLTLGYVQKTNWRRGARRNERQEAHPGQLRSSETTDSAHRPTARRARRQWSERLQARGTEALA